MDIYDELMKRDNYDPQLHLFKAACLYAFTQYKESKVEAEKCHEDTPLKNRLLFQLA
jgi:intraflagellar transport protein 56